MTIDEDKTPMVDAVPPARIVPDFRAGQVLMFSPNHKNKESIIRTNTRYFFVYSRDSVKIDTTTRYKYITSYPWDSSTPSSEYVYEAATGLELGQAFLLLKDPVVLPPPKKQRYGAFSAGAVLLEILYNERIIVCITSRIAYSHYLCKVVPRRIDKYGLQNTPDK